MSEFLPEVIIVASLSFFIGSFTFTNITFNIRIYPHRLIRPDSCLSIRYTSFRYMSYMVRYFLCMFVDIKVI